MLQGRVRELGLRVQRLYYCLCIKVYYGILVLLNDGEIRVRTGQLLHEFVVDLVGSGSGKSTLSGAETHEH